MAVVINGSGPVSGVTTLASPTSINGLTLPTDSFLPGMVLVNKTDFSSASTVSLNNVFTSTYDNYAIRINITGASATAIQSLCIRLRSAGADATGGDYFSYEHYSTNTGGPSRAYNAPISLGLLGYSGNQQGSSETDMFYPAIATQTFWQGSGQAWASSNNGFETFANRHTLSNAYDGFTFYPGSGTITGTVRIYGYRNA